MSVFDPQNGWLGFDPTNNMMTSDAHITLAWGRDYGDVTPVKGLTLGGAGQSSKSKSAFNRLDIIGRSGRRLIWPFGHLAIGSLNDW